MLQNVLKNYFIFRILQRSFNCQASYTFHEMLNNKTTLHCSKTFFLKKLENQNILSMYTKFSNWLNKLVSYLISNWDDSKNI